MNEFIFVTIYDGFSIILFVQLSRNDKCLCEKLSYNFYFFKCNSLFSAVNYEKIIEASASRKAYVMSV